MAYVTFGESVQTSELAQNVWLGLAIVWLVAMIGAPAIGLMDAVHKLAAGDAAGLRKGAITVKLAGIPFFVLNYVVVAMVALLLQLLASMWAGGAILALFNWAGVGVVMVVTYLVMLPTSAYGWAGLIWLRRNRAVSNTFFVLNAILHTIFVVDILSSLIVAARIGEVSAQADTRGDF